MMTKSLQFSVRGFGILLLAQSILFAMGTAGPAQAGEAVPWVSAMAGKPDTLSVKHQGGEWFRATLNTPLIKGDDVWLEAGGRAEIFVNPSSFIRLSGPASLRFDTLQDLSFDIAQNLGQVQFQTGPDTEVFLVTPNLGLTIHANTRARINVAEDESTEVTTERGEVELNGPAGYATVHAGQSLYSAAGNNNYNLTGAPRPDDFDRWSEQRDRELASTPPTPGPVGQYLPPPAANSLSANGYWYSDPTYGWAWRPNSVPPDWSPYTVGHWGWWPGWGWTWISYEPWGWYPYHYGNWVMGVSGWIWAPGPIVSVGWSPALVFWLDGPDWIGWCPLPFGVDLVLFQRNIDRDPHSVYRYVQQNNITVVNVNNFNTTNYINVRRTLPANYRTTARVAADNRHEFSGIRNVRDFETSGPRGWVPQDRRPPEHLSNRVAPAWESNGRPGRGMHQEQLKGERPERTVERALPPGRGQDRTPPARHEAAGAERHGRGPGEVAPPGQIKEGPGHPGREEGVNAPPSGPGKEKPERPLPPGREERTVTPPAGPNRERTERPTPPGREEGAVPPSGEGRGRGERPMPQGREEGAGSSPPSAGPTPERPTPPGREERGGGQPLGPSNERPTPPAHQERPAAPSRGQGPAATPPPPKQHEQAIPPGREQPPSAPAGEKPGTPAPEPKSGKPSKDKKGGAFLYSPPGRERWLAESSGFMDRAQRNTLSPGFAPPGWNARLAESSGSAPRARNDSSSLRFSPPNRDHLGAATSGVADSSPRDAGLRWFTPRGERTNSSWAGSPNRPQLSGNKGSSPVFSRPSFGGNSRSGFRAPAPSRPSFSGGSSFSHRGGSGGSSPSSAGRSFGSHFSGSRGTTPKGR
jgi:hypothetical protein